MFPFLGFRNVQKNLSKINNAVDKMHKNELKIEDILDDEDLVNDLKSLTYTQLMSL
jgi:hypothetical protein